MGERLKTVMKLPAKSKDSHEGDVEHNSHLSQGEEPTNLKKQPAKALSKNKRTSTPVGISVNLPVSEEFKDTVNELLKRGNMGELPRTRAERNPRVPSNAADLAIQPESSVTRTYSFQQDGVNKNQLVNFIVSTLNGPLCQFFVHQPSPDKKEEDEPINSEDTGRPLQRGERIISSVIRGLIESQHLTKSWSSMPQVISSPVLKRFSKKEIALEEAKFEILTSEASYYKSLAILEIHFGWSKQLNSVLSKTEYNYLFGHVKQVRSVSERVLHELTKCFEDSILMTGLSYKILDLVKQHFHCYLTACTKQPLIDRTLNTLSKKGEFTHALKELESSSKCDKLSLSSFLILPMQRILRMPLLVESVVKRLKTRDAELRSWQEALSILKKLARDCDEACGNVNNMELRLTQLNQVIRSLHFPLGVQPLGLLSSDRRIELEDLFTYIESYRCDRYLLVESTESQCHTGHIIKLILFNDYLLVTKATGNNQFLVLNYCHRENSRIHHDENMTNECTFSLTLPIIDNKKFNEVWILESSNVKKRDNWCNVLPLSKDNWKDSGEHIDSETCSSSTQQFINNDNFKTVVSKYAYTARKPDELDLEVGDDILLIDECDDGWSYGERLRDGQKGYFPANYTQVCT